jgi:hypothetical protein
MAFVPFIDITGSNASRAPLVHGGVRAYYVTGSQGIEETAAQIAAAKAAGMGIILIDQTRSLSLFAAGLADVADVESGAAVPATAAAAVALRQKHEWESTLYVSYSALPALRASVKNQSGVVYGVADYSWSIAESEELLNANADWVYCQYGDNITNKDTRVPGTSVTCGQAGCDIDVAKSQWANQFLVIPPAVPSATTHKFKVPDASHTLAYWAGKYGHPASEIAAMNPEVLISAGQQLTFPGP